MKLLFESEIMEPKYTRNGELGFFLQISGYKDKVARILISIDKENWTCICWGSGDAGEDDEFDQDDDIDYTLHDLGNTTLFTIDGYCGNYIKYQVFEKED